MNDERLRLSGAFDIHRLLTDGTRDPTDAWIVRFVLRISWKRLSFLILIGYFCAHQMSVSRNSFSGDTAVSAVVSFRSVKSAPMTMVRSTAFRRFLLGLSLVVLCAGSQAQYTAGDYGSWVTGNWNTVGTWRIYDGVSWPTSPAAGSVPNATHTVYIRGGTTVTAAFGSGYQVANLIVETGGKLYNNNVGPTNLSYVDVYGTTLTCDGQIGNGATLDGISFNIEGSNVALSGTGTFDCARIRKSANANPITLAALALTNFTISMNVNLRFSGGTNTMIYNNFTGTTTFNVIISPGSTVTLVGASGSGNLAIDGTNGTGVGNRRGSFTVNGTLIVPGTIYVTTNNTPAGNPCSFTINNGGVVRTAQLDTGPTGSLAGGHTLTINSGGILEITGTPVAWTNYNTTNNFFSLNSASRVIYSGAGSQDVRPIAGGYGHLRIMGTGTKALSGLTAVRGDLEILNSTGTPVLDAIAVSNFQLNVSGNWTNYNQSGFEERAAIVNFAGTAGPQTINTPGGENFYTWRFSKTVAQPLVTMLSDVQVANNVELNTGILDLNANQLTVTNPFASAISTTVSFSTQRHIRSERTDNLSRVRWDIGITLGGHLVPFGTTAAYTPFTFDLASGNAGSVTMATYGTAADNLPWPTTPVAVTNLASYYGLTPDNRDATVDRFWEVDVTGTPVAGLTFTYAPSELPLAPWNDPLSMRAQRWNSTNQGWEVEIAGSSVAYSATTDWTVSSFGPFTLSPVNSPLPVELLSFDARLRGEEVELTWATASERDNDHFTVERSTDGVDFSDLLRVEGAGNSQVLTNYEALDRVPLEGLSYYRLRQTDTDGRFTHSRTVAVLNDALGAGPLLFPNPATDMVTAIGMPVEAADIRVLDQTGRVVLVLRKEEGSDRLPIIIEQLPAGSYLLQVEGAQRVSTGRFVRQ